jgi:hypothetical protein
MWMEMDPFQGRNTKAELNCVMGELLVGKVPKEPKYAELDSQCESSH